MKLNIKRTILIGFAFLSICAFWQMYNSVIPLMLTNTFHLNETFSGAIMAADNVLALFLLPFFGVLSDKCKSPLGKRRPYILRGTIAAVVLMLLIPLLDNSYSAAREPWKVAAFIAVLGCLLVAMGSYRSPAVALMPDVTPRKLRSKGNAIINLMGAVGGIIYLILASVLYSSKEEGHVNYLLLFIIVAVIMLLALVIVMTCIDERALQKEMEDYEASHPDEILTQQDAAGQSFVPADVKRSLVFLLFSIALWFIGYNAVETWFTTYATSVWNMSLGKASLCLTIATAGAIISYIPIGEIASKIGRRRTIITGIVLLSSCFMTMFIYSRFADFFHPALYVLFMVVGLSWAAINVNSLPMVLEMCRESDIGRYTGFYYTFSMTAQIVTPIIAGFLMNHTSYQALFPYAAIFVAASFVTMLFVRHGDSKIIEKRGLEAFDVDD